MPSAAALAASSWRPRFRRKAALPPMPVSKRVFDVVVSLLLLLLLWPVLLATMLLLLITEGRPIFYLGERMCSPDRSFKQIKFRTMRVGADAVGGVTGGDKANSISPLHRILRRTRADELPQLINVLKGEMSLVGPRPPMRSYVEAFPEIYNQVLQSRPGVTGLATLRFHQHEERLLAACRTHRETEAVYRRRCIPRKARLDLIYQSQRTLGMDIVLVMQTARKPFWRVHSRNQFPLPRMSARKAVRIPRVSRATLAAARSSTPAPAPTAHPAE
ncbi:sugar transferase [Rubellimicrobium arenae]|uniref:sugar transferase n=1 Tax=Rubellimicrobium arenae TaxID=2817372 RepID=UPI0034A51AF4